MSAAVFLRKVADFLDTHPGETAPFTVAVTDRTSFHGGLATVGQVEDLMTALGGVWDIPVEMEGVTWGTSHDTSIGRVTIFAPRSVLTDVLEGLPKAWVAA